MPDEPVYGIKAKFDTAGAEKQLDSFSKKIGSAAQVMAGAWAGSKIVGFFKDTVTAAAESEKQVSKLAQAMKTAGTYSDAAQKDLQSFAEEMISLTGNSDEATISVMSFFTAVNKLSGQALKDATKATADLAVRLGIDLESAGRLVSKAIEGNVMMLQRYGVHIKTSTDRAKMFKNVMEGVAGIAGGAALANTKTFSGQLSVMAETFDNLKEAIGTGFIPLFEKMIPLINKASTAVTNFLKPQEEQTTSQLTARKAQILSRLGEITTVGTGPTSLSTLKDGGFLGKLRSFLPGDTVNEAKKLSAEIVKIDQLLSVPIKEFKPGVGGVSGTTARGKKGSIGDNFIDTALKERDKLVKENARLMAHGAMGTMGPRPGGQVGLGNYNIDRPQDMIDFTKSLVDANAATEEAITAKKSLEIEARKKMEEESLTFMLNIGQKYYDKNVSVFQNFADMFKGIWKEMIISYIDGQEKKILADTAAGYMSAVASKNWAQAGIITAESAGALALAESAKASIAGLASGGIVSGDGIYRIGEMNKREAVIPLESPQGRRTISDAMAAGGGGAASSTQNITLQIDGIKLAEIMANKAAQGRRQGRY